MTLSMATTDDGYASALDSLAENLAVITPNLANAARLAFDARFSDWLTEIFKLPGISVESSTTASEDLIHFELRTSNGELAFGLEPSSWPALRLVAELPDFALAAAVANVMLEPLAALLAPVLGNIVLTSIRIYSTLLTNTPCLNSNNKRALLLSCDATIVNHIRRLWNDEKRSVDVTVFGRLQLRGRIVCMQRHWPQHILRSLAPGDLVLPPDLQVGAECSFVMVGCGFGIRAGININFKEHTVHVVDTPKLESQDQVTEHGAQPIGINELQLPISFELDTARVSLSELAVMRPGYMIELDLPLNEIEVRLVCQGQTIGQGQLIAISDRVGVRITRMSFVDE
jgi:type III secretion protein Q